MQDAVNKLNSLQSNAQILQVVRQSRGALNKRSIPEMHEFLERMGLQVRKVQCSIRTLPDRCYPIGPGHRFKRSKHYSRYGHQGQRVDVFVCFFDFAPVPSSRK